MGAMNLSMRTWRAALAGPLLAAAFSQAFTPALAQDAGSLNPKPLAPLAKPDDPALAARELFARRTLPASMAARSIGFYSRGCLAGGEALAVDGDAWQVMRLSRNRNWGHPELVSVVERIARAAKLEKT